MTRDLQKNVPIVVLAAAEGVLAEALRLVGNYSVAQSASIAHTRLALRDREKHGREWEQRAQSLIDWGANLRRALPLQRLTDEFGAQECEPSISIVCHEIALPAEGTAPGGRLKTELMLDLSPSDETVFRHYAWFDGNRVAHGGILNSTYGMLLTIHPEMLRQIHDLVAEGKVWDRVIAGLKSLLSTHKDR